MQSVRHVLQYPEAVEDGVGQWAAWVTGLLAY